MSGARFDRTGLPGPLPEGEVVLWQGSPEARAVARRILHGRAIAVYFAALAAWSLGTGWFAGRAAGAMLLSLAPILAGAAAVLALGCVFAMLVARTTVYTITTRRVVMRIGIALPVTLNVPFGIVRGAGLKLYPDGTGDLPLALDGPGRIAWLHLWPHGRPWRLGRPEPMLRVVPDAERVAAILARAFGEARPEPATSPEARPLHAARKRRTPMHQAA